MNEYREYRRKLTSANNAVTTIKDNDIIVHSGSVSEPPALLNALADHLRADDLKHIKVYTSLPGPHAATSLLSPDLSDCVESYSWFVTEADRSLVKVGLSIYVPNYIHQVPRLIREIGRAHV